MNDPDRTVQIPESYDAIPPLTAGTKFLGPSRFGLRTTYRIEAIDGDQVYVAMRIGDTFWPCDVQTLEWVKKLMEKQ